MVDPETGRPSFAYTSRMRMQAAAEAQNNGNTSTRSTVAAPSTPSASRPTNDNILAPTLEDLFSFATAAAEHGGALRRTTTATTTAQRIFARTSSVSPVIFVNSAADAAPGYVLRTSQVVGMSSMTSTATTYAYNPRKLDLSTANFNSDTYQRATFRVGDTVIDAASASSTTTVTKPLSSVVSRVGGFFGSARFSAAFDGWKTWLATNDQPAIERWVATTFDAGVGAGKAGLSHVVGLGGAGLFGIAGSYVPVAGTAAGLVTGYVVGSTGTAYGLERATQTDFYQNGIRQPAIKFMSKSAYTIRNWMMK